MDEPQDTLPAAEYQAPTIEDVNDGGVPLAAAPGGRIIIISNAP